MINQTAFSSEAFVVGDQKVSILPVESFKALLQTFWSPTTAGIIISYDVLNKFGHYNDFSRHCWCSEKLPAQS